MISVTSHYESAKRCPTSKGFLSTETICMSNGICPYCGHSAGTYNNVHTELVKRLVWRMWLWGIIVIKKRYDQWEKA